MRSRAEPRQLALERPRVPLCENRRRLRQPSRDSAAAISLTRSNYYLEFSEPANNLLAVGACDDELSAPFA